MTNPTEALIYEEIEAVHGYYTAKDIIKILKKLIKTKQIRITRWKLNRKAG